MRFVALPNPPASRDVQDIFGGYNHNVSIPDTDFYDMLNMSCDGFPTICTRKKRAKYDGIQTSGKIHGICSREKLCVVDGPNLIVGDTSLDLGLSSDPGTIPKQMISMGRHVIIWPDMVYADTVDFRLANCGRLDATAKQTSTYVQYMLCDKDGKILENVTFAASAPDSPEDGALWMNTGVLPDASLSRYSAAAKDWISIRSYLRVTFDADLNGVREGDMVIPKLPDGDLTGPEGPIWSVQADMIRKAMSDVKEAEIVPITGSGSAYGNVSFVIKGYLNEASTQVTSAGGPFTVQRYVPKMDYICEAGNRLWGCRYGSQTGAEKSVNEIYASAQGDFRKWRQFKGIASDSYGLSLGSDGPFTAAITFHGEPHFFKERTLHRIMGLVPANFHIQTINIRGVHDGDYRSLAIIDEVLYYKSGNEICSFDGSLPNSVSQQLGTTTFLRGVGGTHNGKYYIAMQDAGEDAQKQEYLYVYDTRKRLWTKESATMAELFCTHKGQLLYVERGPEPGDGSISVIDANPDQLFGLEEDTPWYLETGPIGAAKIDATYIRRLIASLSMEFGAETSILIRYDDSEDWVSACTAIRSDLKVRNVSLRPRRCHHFRLRFEGTGFCRLYAIAKVYRRGSEMR